MTIVSQTRPRAAAIFAHHIGQGPEVEGYGAKGWAIKRGSYKVLAVQDQEEGIVSHVFGGG